MKRTVANSLFAKMAKLKNSVAQVIWSGMLSYKHATSHHQYSVVIVLSKTIKKMETILIQEIFVKA